MQSLLIDVARLTAWLVALALLFAPLERIFTLRHADQRRSRLADLGYFYMNGILPALLLALPLALLSAGVNAVTPSSWRALVSSLPLGVSLVAGLLLAELGSYWAHRLTHRSPLLWRFHAVHHSPEHIDWLANSRAHPVDIIFVRLAGLVPIYLVGLDGGGRQNIVPVVITLIGTVWSFAIHANVRWRFGFFEQLIATPAFHHWHHTNDEYRDHNFASTLPIFDRIFGTLHLPAQFPTVYGVDDAVPPNFYDELVGPIAGAWRGQRAAADKRGSSTN